MSYTKYHSIEHVEDEDYSSTTSVSLVVQELTESEVSNLPPSVIQASLEEEYEIRDDDKLTEHDFFSLMNSEDDSESESESDIEYHWFPSLLKNSSIQFIEDNHNEDTLMNASTEVTAEIEEQDSDTQAEEDDEEEEDNRHIGSLKRKRHGRHQKHSKGHKKSRKTENVPIEVVYIKF